MNKYLLALVVIFGIITISLSKRVTSLKEENNRIRNNFNNVVKNELKVVKDKNNELHSVVNTLQLQKDEFESLYSDTQKELENMRIKTKNVRSIVKTNTIFKYIQKDSIQFVSVPISDTVFNTKYTDNKWFSTEWKTEISKNNSVINISDFKITANDSIYVVSEIEYRGFWFWRKPKNIKLHIKSKNPYISHDSVESIDLLKK